MIALIFFLFIVPYFYGLFFVKENKYGRLLTIPVGLMVELVLWTLASLPIVFWGGHFSTSVYIYIVINSLIVLSKCITLIKQNRITNLKKEAISCIKECLHCFKSRIFIIMFVVILFQCVRSTFFQQAYGDNRVYVAIVNDTIETDRYYSVDENDGNLNVDTSSVAKKYMLSTWYTYEAFLSKVSGVEPLIMIYTILPGYLLALSYVVWWGLSAYFLRYDMDKMALFTLFLALFYELNAEDVSSYLLYWPTYGKNITASIVMPLLLLFWIMYNKSFDQMKYIYMMLLMAVGCVVSVMGIMIMSIEISFLHLIYIIINRKITLKFVIRYLALMIPVMLYGIVYIRI